MATPLLSLLGFPAFVAVASPLPATVPSTVVASAEYWRSRLLDWEIVWWSIGIGTPAIVAGSFLPHSVGAKPLLVVPGVLVLGFGISFLFFPKDRSLAKEAADNLEGLRPLLANTSNHGRNWRGIYFGIAGERRGISLRAQLHGIPQAADEEGFRMFAGGFFRPRHTRHNRSCLSWPHFVACYRLGRARRSPFLSSGRTSGYQNAGGKT